MPTLPLYTPNPGHPDGSHQVIAPGGYERWYFDAESTTGDVVIVAVFAQGSPDHPHYAEYLRHYRKYLRGPTRHRPPVPADYASVSLAVYEQGRALAQSVEAIAPGALHASPDHLELAAPPHVVTSGSDGCMRVRVGGADLVFRPTLTDGPRDLTQWSRPDPSRHHYWVLASFFCAVEGTVQVQTGRSLEFSGRGFHDHQYGT